MISEKQIRSIVSQRLPNFTPTSELQPVTGGNLNHLWRLAGKMQSLIVKWAPPYIASSPEIPLSPKRIGFEARALQLFVNGNFLSSIASDEVRPPHIVHYEEGQHLLIMEDLGLLPSIDYWLATAKDTPTLGKMLGAFIGRLHRQTYQDQTLAKHFNNANIQDTRKQVQYNPAADYAAKCGALNDDFNLIQSKTKTLGQRLCTPGKCLVMGDLWPPSILVDDGALRIIDWEFVHFGRPLQDVGHFAAHCWMQAHIASSDSQKAVFRTLWEKFWLHYRQALGEQFDALFDDREYEYMNIHIGAEILNRACGAFKEGYVYEQQELHSDAVLQAVQKALQLIRHNQLSILWENI